MLFIFETTCSSCNESFSLDEEYLFAFLSCVRAGSTDPNKQQNPRESRTLKRQAKLRTRIENSKTEFKAPYGELKIVWEPEWERINRVFLKNARGHAFYEIGEPMLEEPSHVWAATFHRLTAEQRTDFENIDSGGVVPEVGSRLLTRVMTGQDLSGDWVIVQEGTYRFALVLRGGVLVRSVLNEYLATEVFWKNWALKRIPIQMTLFFPFHAGLATLAFGQTILP